MSASISVVVPCFNAAAWLRDSLGSVAAQDRRPLEVLVSDDGSTDGSAALAEALGARVIRSGARGGPAAARNAGMAEARGDFVAFLDADDLWTPDHLRELAGLLEAKPSALLAFGRVRKFGAATECTPAHPAVGAPVELLETLLDHNPVPQSTVVARREELHAAGGYDATRHLSEDYDLWLRLAARGQFVCTNAITCRYRVHAQQATVKLGALITASWEVRIAAAERAVTSGRLDRATVDRLLAAAYAAEWAWVWDTRDSAAIHALFREGARVPGAATVARGWRSRVRWQQPWRGLLGRLLAVLRAPGGPVAEG